MAAVTDQYNNSLSNGFMSSTRNEQNLENIRMLRKLRNMKSQVNSFDLPSKYQQRNDRKFKLKQLATLHKNKIHESQLQNESTESPTNLQQDSLMSPSK